MNIYSYYSIYNSLSVFMPVGYTSTEEVSFFQLSAFANKSSKMLVRWNTQIWWIQLTGVARTLISRVDRLRKGQFGVTAKWSWHLISSFVSFSFCPPVYTLQAFWDRFFKEQLSWARTWYLFAFLCYLPLSKVNGHPVAW